MSEQDTSHLPKDVFTMSQLESVWQLFGTNFGKTNFNAKIIVKSSQLALNSSKITVLVNGPVQQKQLLEFREELTLFLRKQLNNYAITVESGLIASNETEQKAYTSAEKFKLMSETNPAILKLKEILQLEVTH